MKFVTGYGAKDTHGLFLGDGRQNTHSSAGTTYGTVDLQAICNMVANPPSVDKAEGQWIIPSEYHEHDARSHSVQRENGKFHALAVDIDKGDLSLQDVDACLSLTIGRAWRAVWSTPSSSPDDKRWRVLIPISTPLGGEGYSCYQASLFDALAAEGVVCDRSLERPGQVLYLPNSGEFYQWMVEGDSLMDPTTHPLINAAAERYAEIAAEQYNAAKVAANDGARSFIGAFRRKHSIEELLALYGGEQSPTNADLWRWPGQSTPGYGSIRIMRYPDSDRWVSMSETFNVLGVGKVTNNNTRSGDAFDLYLHFNCGGNQESARAYAEQCWDEENRVFIEHGEELFAGMWCCGEPVGPGAFKELAAQREEEVKEAKAHEEELAKAEKEKWGGEWLNDVPFRLTPSKLEWLAWHAPNVIGMAVRQRSVKAVRHSVVPLMLGTLGALSYTGQGKFVGLSRRYVTPVGIMMFQVGASGSGKSDGTGTFYSIVNELDQSGIRADRVKTFASGQSLTSYLSEKNAHVFMLQNEGGADRKAGRGNAHFESLMAGVTDAYTAFEDGIEATYTKSDETEGKAISHPTIGALASSTPKKLFSSIENADGESGWLGRNLFIPLKSTLTNKAAVLDMKYDHLVTTSFQRIVQQIPAMPTGADKVWIGKHGAFHALSLTEESEQMLDQFVDECDAFCIDERRGDVERAVYGRAAEAANRLATVVGLGHWALTGEPLINRDAMWWAVEVTKESLAYVTSKMDNMVEEDILNAGPAGKIRAAVKTYFGRAETDKKFFNSFGNGARIGPDKEVQLTFSKLKVKVKDNLGAQRSMVDSELRGMIEDGQMVEVAGPIELGTQNNQKWLKWLG
jgi:hypothetical protein